MSFFARRGHMCYRNYNIFFIIFGDGEVSEKFPLRGLPFARLRLWPAASGAQHAAKSCVGGLSQVWKSCGGCKRPARVSEVCPPHGRRRRRHLEDGNGRVGSTRKGSCCGSGPDVAPKCSYGLT